MRFADAAAYEEELWLSFFNAWEALNHAPNLNSNIDRNKFSHLGAVTEFIKQIG